MSGAPIISGTNQLPKPPIIAGMTMKKIMIRPCAVVEHVEQVRAVFAGEDLHSRMHQLHAHADGKQAADHAADDREDKVHRADVLMVRRIDVTAPPGGVIVRVRGRRREPLPQLP